ncbi:MULTISPECIES: hypothetical protein [unclassified Anabaena]|nr:MULTISPECIES: hypothetical protein [unclassified Anabaena]
MIFAYGIGGQDPNILPENLGIVSVLLKKQTVIAKVTYRQGSKTYLNELS